MLNLGFSKGRETILQKENRSGNMRGSYEQPAFSMFKLHFCH